MDPFMRDGDVLLVGPLRRKPELGRVVAVRNSVSGRLVVHRVVARTRGGVLVRGDGAGRADGEATPGGVLGVVGGVERRGRRVHLGQGPERVPDTRCCRGRASWSPWSPERVARDARSAVEAPDE